MKIRGSASHIAGKYSSLARDARATGDPVSSENYWQHAEHYNRIVQSAESQAQEKRQNAVANTGANGGQRHQPNDGHAQAQDNRQKNAANGAASGLAQGADPNAVRGGQDAIEGGAQEVNPPGDENTRQTAVKGDTEAVAKPVRKRAKPGTKTSAKPATAKAETVPTEEAG